MVAGDGMAAGAGGFDVRNAKVTTLCDGGGAAAEAVAVRGDRFAAVAGEAEVMRLAGEGTRVVDTGGRRVIPGLSDSHLHAIRGGLHFNLELRWDGAGSLARGLEMIRRWDRTINLHRQGLDRRPRYMRADRILFVLLVKRFLLPVIWLPVLGRLGSAIRPGQQHARVGGGLAPGWTEP